MMYLPLSHPSTSSSSNLALVGFARFLSSPPARSFYFSFIFPTREPSRCNLHPSCCCCRRPSRLPRATTGVAQTHHRRGIICQKKEIFRKFDRDCKYRLRILLSFRNEAEKKSTTFATYLANKRSLLIAKLVQGKFDTILNRYLSVYFTLIIPIFILTILIIYFDI